MAKWGEGDPRWLVEHRDDGRNVNNWHWSEVNKMEWSKQRLAELLPGTEAAAAAGSDGGWAARVTHVKSVTGEAMLTTRKGNKRFAFYDLKLSLSWEASPLAPACAAEGEAAPPSAGAAAGSGAAQPAGGTSSQVGAAQAAGEDGEPAAEAADGAAAAGGGSPARDGGAAAPAPAAAGSAGDSLEPAVTGEMSVAEFGSGSDHDDIELTVTVSGGSASSTEKEAMRRHAQTALWPRVLQRLEQFAKELEQC